MTAPQDRGLFDAEIEIFHMDEWAEDLIEARSTASSLEVAAIIPGAHLNVGPPDSWVRALSAAARSSHLARGDEVYEPDTRDVDDHNIIPSPGFGTKSGNGDALFTHCPLDDPETQIRLLSRSKNEGWDLGVYEISIAPSYAALSYEWGSAEDSAVLIRIGKASLSVTSNCSLALRQLWACLDFDYFWIDAICIDQADDNEKGHQVQAMAEIYAKATCTFISLGLHDVDSLRVYNALHSLNRAYRVRAISRLTTEAFEELWLSLLNVGQRSYWRRLWIYQELILSRELKLLCGQDVATWTSFAGLLCEFEGCLDGNPEYNKKVTIPFDFATPECNRNVMIPSNFARSISLLKHFGDRSSGFQMMMDIIDRRSQTVESNKTLDMYRLLELTRERHCFDSRDRVFGVMRLVRWPKRIDSMKVDYHQAPFQVAIDVLHHYRPHSSNAAKSAVTLVSCLGIDRDAHAALKQEQIAGLYTAHLLPTTMVMKHTTRLQQAANGALEGDFSVDYNDSMWPRVQMILPSDISTKFRRLVGQNNMAVGFVSIHCKPGDIILQLAEHMHAVIREDGKRSFKVVGRAVLGPSVSVHRILHDRWSGENLGEQAAYEVYFHAYDILHWACNKPQCESGKLRVSDLNAVLIEAMFDTHVVCIAHPVSLMTLSRKQMKEVLEARRYANFEKDRCEELFRDYLQHGLLASTKGRRSSRHMLTSLETWCVRLKVERREEHFQEYLQYCLLASARGQPSASSLDTRRETFLTRMTGFFKWG